MLGRNVSNSWVSAFIWPKVLGHAAVTRMSSHTPKAVRNCGTTSAPSSTTGRFTSERTKPSKPSTAKSRDGRLTSTTPTAAKSLLGRSNTSVPDCDAGCGGGTNAKAAHTNATRMNCSINTTTSGNCPLGPHGNMPEPKANRRSVLGKPDAGNPPVRFDEGWRACRETDNYGRFNSRHSPPTLPANPTLSD